MNNPKIVSQTDITHLKLIRENVRKSISKYAANFDNKDVLILDIAPQVYKGAKEFFKKATVKTLDINPKSGADFIADLCNDNSSLIKSSYFDLIICTEVLEHTSNPFKSVIEMYRLLKSGGTAIVSTPFNFRIHGPLPDYWRFSEYGLRELFKSFKNVSIETIETNGRNLFPIHYTTIAVK